MALPDRDVERLDHALDANLNSRKETNPGTPADLLEAFSRLRAMNEQVQVDSTLKQELWRSMMSAMPLSPSMQSIGSSRLASPGKHNIPFIGRKEPMRRTRALAQYAIAAALILAIAIGAIGYQQRGDENGAPTIPAPLAAQLTYDGPDVSACTTTAREPGTVASLAGSPPTIPASLPRMGRDPFYDLVDKSGKALNEQQAANLLLNSQELSSIPDGVDQLLTQLVDCSPYAGPYGNGLDVDGRYFALFSDDYFRRELSGYREAGLDLTLQGGFWLPPTKPVVLQARSQGERVILIFKTNPIYDSSYQVLILAKGTSGWLVDEVGSAAFSEEWSASVGIPAATPITGNVLISAMQQNVTLLDTEFAGTPAPSATGLTVPCSLISNGKNINCGWFFRKAGPYWYQEYPANTDFTFVFSNISSESRRVEVPELGVSLEIAAYSSAPLALNADPGRYTLVIYDGDEQTPLDAGRLVFIESDGDFTT